MASSAGPLDCLLIVTNEELGDVALKGCGGQAITLAGQGHLGSAMSSALGAGELICMTGFVTRECPNSCASGTGQQCLAPAPEQSVEG